MNVIFENAADIKAELIKFIEEKTYDLYDIPIVCNGGGLDFVSEDRDAEWVIKQVMDRDVEFITKGEEYEDFQDIAEYDDFEFIRLKSTAEPGQPSNEIQIAVW